MTPFFTSRLRTEWLEDPARPNYWLWLVTIPFGFVSSRGEFVAVPANRLTNGASIPSFARWCLSPANWYFNSAVIHDELCDEQNVFREEEKHLVYDYSQECVKNVVREMDNMEPHVFDGALASISDCRYKVSSFRAAQIMDEAMQYNPCITPDLIRLLVFRCVCKWGPQWK